MSFSLKNFRDWIWNYPDSIAGFLSSTKPLGYVVASVLLAILIFSYLIELKPSSLMALDGPHDTTLDEAAIGQVVTLNPIYINQNYVDRDLHQLIYEKLLYIAPSGDAQPAIAESWEFQDSGKKLIIKISDKYYWHDGEKVDADDVLFTMSKAIELSGNSRFDTFGNSLEDVTVSKIDERTLSVTLEEYSSTLLEALSFYVIPKHLLEDLDEDELFTYGLLAPPVGSGMYQVTTLRPDKVELDINEDFPFGESKPKIKKISYTLFESLDDMKVSYMNRDIDSISGLEEEQYASLLEYKPVVHTMHLKNHKKVLYFNVNNERIKPLELRKGLSYSIDKNVLISEAEIKGKSAHSPILSDSWALNSTDIFYAYNLDSALKSFEAAGYTQPEGEEYLVDKDGNTLNLTITYHSDPKNERIADELQKMLLTVGVKLEKNPVDYGRLVNEVLARRDFELLLLEIETNIDPDQYNLWHSTKKNYPDLNISGYEYSRVDVLLERARKTQVREDRLNDYTLFQRYIAQDVPAIVLYEPEFEVLMNAKVKNVSLDGYVYPHERFRDIGNWELDQ